MSTVGISALDRAAGTGARRLVFLEITEGGKGRAGILVALVVTLGAGFSWRTGC